MEHLLRVSEEVLRSRDLGMSVLEMHKITLDIFTQIGCALKPTQGDPTA